MKKEEFLKYAKEKEMEALIAQGVTEKQMEGAIKILNDIMDGLEQNAMEKVAAAPEDKEAICLAMSGTAARLAGENAVFYKMITERAKEIIEKVIKYGMEEERC